MMRPQWLRVKHAQFIKFGMRERIKTDRVTLMMAPAESAAVDEWRRQQSDLPSRSEAIRRLLQIGLQATQQQGHQPPELKVGPSA